MQLFMIEQTLSSRNIAKYAWTSSFTLFDHGTSPNPNMKRNSKILCSQHGWNQEVLQLYACGCTNVHITTCNNHYKVKWSNTFDRTYVTTMRLCLTDFESFDMVHGKVMVPVHMVQSCVRSRPRWRLLHAFRPRDSSLSESALFSTLHRTWKRIAGQL